MDNSMYTYLQWRFKENNNPRYLKYMDEWISKVTDTQILYFEKERERLRKNGSYSM